MPRWRSMSSGDIGTSSLSGSSDFSWYGMATSCSSITLESDFSLSCPLTAGLFSSSPVASGSPSADAESSAINWTGSSTTSETSAKTSSVSIGDELTTVTNKMATQNANTESDKNVRQLSPWSPHTWSHLSYPFVFVSRLFFHLNCCSLTSQMTRLSKSMATFIRQRH
jgi:hypothetical protein